MASLIDKIRNDLKEAMRSKCAEEVSVLRMFTSAVKDREIALRKGEDISLNDEQILEVLSSEVKKRKDSIEAYRSGGRNDLAEKEESEIKILDKYMPEQMGEEEIEKIVKEVVDSAGDVGMKDFGMIMGKLMPKVKGKADGNIVSGIVKKILS